MSTHRRLIPRHTATGLLLVVLVMLARVAAAQDFAIPGINAWGAAKAHGFTFQPLVAASGQSVTNPRDGVNTLLQVKQGVIPLQTTVTLGQVVGGNATTIRPASGTRTVTFEFFGGRTLAPGWTVVRVELAGNYLWDRPAPVGGQSLSFRVKATSTSASTGMAVIKNIVLRGPDGANPYQAFCPIRNGRMKLAAPFNLPHVFSPPIGVDHDPVNQPAGAAQANCKSYKNLPFPTCYDGHQGTDFLLAGGFLTMDLGSLDVVASAPGVVEKVEDSEFDRCFADLLKQTIDCQGNLSNTSQLYNEVKIRQDDGLLARYVHLKKDTVTVRVGQRVSCGARIGKVGSSGVSAAPHLHFQLEQSGTIVDPYKEGLWVSRNPLDVPNGKCPF